MAGTCKETTFSFLAVVSPSREDLKKKGKKTNNKTRQKLEYKMPSHAN